eukprot:2055505-Pyramimonas_sp.AAC.1
MDPAHSHPGGRTCIIPLLRRVATQRRRENMIVLYSHVAMLGQKQIIPFCSPRGNSEGRNKMRTCSVRFTATQRGDTNAYPFY